MRYFRTGLNPFFTGEESIRNFPSKFGYLGAAASNSSTRNPTAATVERTVSAKTSRHSGRVEISVLYINHANLAELGSINGGSRDITVRRLLSRYIVATNVRSLGRSSRVDVLASCTYSRIV